PMFLSACGEDAGGLRATVDTGGPKVVWDITHKPLPEIPLPNDAATIVDDSSPTGRRLNVSLIADTTMESETRALVDRMDGWGMISPITVKFDAPLDIEELLKNYLDDFDFKNDPVVVVNIDPKSKDFKKAVHLDMCRGNYPLTLGEEGLFFENDPHYYDNNVLFEEWDEDLNGNGELDEGEDRDFDHVLDKPNIHPAGACDSARKDLIDAEASNAADKKERRRLYDQCIVKHLLSCYERETNSLILRPLEPLDQKSVYAAVITKNLVGENGKSVQSPFPFINHLGQTLALGALEEALADYGMNLDDVAFTWTFTTQSLTRDIEALRAGLYGFGPFKKLKDEYPPAASFKPGQLQDSGDGNLYKVKADDLIEILEPYIPLLGGGDPAGINKLIEELSQIDYLVIGVFESPYFLADKDGVATDKYPADDDESFELDHEKGTYVAKPQKIRALCTVPKPTDLAKQPFELVIYAHGYVGFIFEGLGFAGRMAHFGLATCIIEAMGHGIALPPEYMDILDLIMPMFKEKNISSIFNLISPGRARDLNNDGAEDTGGDFWTADLFHTRDVVRQTLVDHLQLIRIMRHFDGKRSWDMDLDKDGKNELFGDFDADGVVDFGGPGKRYYAWGQSLGGFISALLGAIEPALNAVAPISGAGALTDVAIRSHNFGVPEAVMLPMMGPFVLGNPTEDGKLLFEFLLADVVFKKKLPIKVSDKAKPGDKVVFKNLRNKKEG
ncbi:MAG: hypothetical protein FJ088_07765, partial [Deltaproteobacteria bacterium]|nr:hypothetical protein [Deltaproteobacteria bacterium]